MGKFQDSISARVDKSKLQDIISKFRDTKFGDIKLKFRDMYKGRHNKSNFNVKCRTFEIVDSLYFF